MSLIDGIDLIDIKHIFPNNEIKLEYLKLISATTGIRFDNLRTTRTINSAIIKSWDYEISKRIIRDLFNCTEKYEKNRDSKYKLDELMFQWQHLNLGEFEWPFLPIRFDQHVHILNRRNISEAEKDDILSKEIIKYRRIKDINAQRNDYIEYLIFENNENIIPTLGNSKGVDFYINGEPYDQKVGRSVGTTFIEEFGSNYKEIAINSPHLVARSLYEGQDEARFGSENRLLIVYLDNDLDIGDIEASLANVDFRYPMRVEFEYEFSNGKIIPYETYCYIVLLHK
ncbi:MAG: hypothetical protein IJX99_00635 [Clostridia bacterium]|nr:hypothetical protein [Clostridia bacterium]